MKVQRLESKTVTCFRGSVIVYGGVKHNIDYLASRKSTQEAFRSRCHNLAKSSL